jgi:hypothetical protein
MNDRPFRADHSWPWRSRGRWRELACTRTRATLDTAGPTFAGFLATAMQSVDSDGHGRFHLRHELLDGRLIRSA